MGIMGMLFSFRGKAGDRLFLTLSLGSSFIVAATAGFLAVSFAHVVMSGLSTVMMIGALPLLAGVLSIWAASIWIIAAVVSKRLSEMERSPLHAIWITLSSAMAGALTGDGVLALSALIGLVWVISGSDRLPDRRSGTMPAA